MDDTAKMSEKPLVSFALFAFNQQEFIGEAIIGALSQTYQPLEIILSDDCSNDNTFAIMKDMAEAYDGPHRLVLRQNKKNVGVAEHVNRVIDLASGELLIVAAGDDISHEDRVSAAVEAFTDDDRLAVLETGYAEIDDLGNATGRIHSYSDVQFDLASYLAKSERRPVGASRTYRTETLRLFPHLSPDCPTEDTTLMLRCLFAGEGRAVSKASIQRRIHDNNLSARKRLAVMPLEPLRDQYLADAKYALHKGMIDSEAFKLATDWARTEFCLRKSFQWLWQGENAFAIARKVTFMQAPWNAKARAYWRLTRGMARSGASE
ncbi:glycosyltransferase [Erythrobacter sp. 3-20A1M]|uniref:glycosyltransferase n=1 Tax=Erythrobacter sp. 3-20A1M TaxID=2653850 RepID=UPI001BFC42A5|nr:glycosyltransferase [Erythrobacter sp. 3-20A1M]QWC57954.1 glycosyltransferase [Erythrobacter sp. 3-20A1M]